MADEFEAFRKIIDYKVGNYVIVALDVGGVKRFESAKIIGVSGNDIKIAYVSDLLAHKQNPEEWVRGDKDIVCQVEPTKTTKLTGEVSKQEIQLLAKRAAPVSDFSRMSAQELIRYQNAMLKSNLPAALKNKRAALIRGVIADKNRKGLQENLGGIPDMDDHDIRRLREQSRRDRDYSNMYS